MGTVHRGNTAEILATGFGFTSTEVHTLSSLISALNIRLT